MAVTRLKNLLTGSEAEIPTEAAPAWIRIGYEAISGSRSEVEAEQERLARENEAAAHLAEVAELVSAEKVPTIDLILAEVGNDPAAAQLALAAEQERDKPRSTLVDRLTPIAGDASTTKEI